MGFPTENVCTYVCVCVCVCMYVCVRCLWGCAFGVFVCVRACVRACVCCIWHSIVAQSIILLVVALIALTTLLMWRQGGYRKAACIWLRNSYFFSSVAVLLDVILMCFPYYVLKRHNACMHFLIQCHSGQVIKATQFTQLVKSCVVYVLQN